jgi:hypothetical protein
MDNINLEIIGSEIFFNLLDDLCIENLYCSSSFDKTSKKIKKEHRQNNVRIIFTDNLSVINVKKYLNENVPTVLLLKNKDYLSKNNINLKNFHISLLVPIEILLFKEILSILISKYNFSKQSEQTVGLYEIDSNQRIIIKNKIKAKLTEKEIQLILLLNSCKDIGIKKEDLLKKIWGHRVNLESHAFETHLHRLRKKIVKYFKDRDFIVEKNSLYFICK